MGCLSCGRGFHSECKKCRKGKCHSKRDKLVRTITGEDEEKPKGKIGRPRFEYGLVTDPKSTGRKRAAREYPILEGEPCEWRGKKSCGGGVPIVGCLDGTQQDRHHGPVKDTLRNESGNVHRICKLCHNRWHSRNDAVYDQARYERLPHKPEPATELEILAGNAEWKVDKSVRPNYH